ncbi:MAG: cellulase family glycosylhydrolase [Ruminococcus sp.]|nr:cellulase family glycosylhydrolase [Ruminococcus sp.]
MLKRFLSVLTAGVVAASTVGVLSASADAVDIYNVENLTATEVVKDMGVGINLGNTFENTYIFETGWGSPKITQEMIQGYKDSGFDSIRIPVAWSMTYSDASTYTIDEDKMDRIKEVVEWALEADMYVIINIHWDGGWWAEEFGTDEEAAMNHYTTVWEQIAEAFKDYGDHLIFESLNEEGGSWASYMTTDESYQILNDINQEFVDLVRESGGNNAYRHLLIAGYETNISETCDSRFVMPTDTVEDKLIVSVHYYSPQGFALLNEDASWAKFRSSWGDASDYAELYEALDELTTTFIDNGIPVIMGECGMGSRITLKDDGAAREFMLAEIDAMLKLGICPVLWDIYYTESDQTNDMVYNRDTCSMTDSELEAGIKALTAAQDDGTLYDMVSLEVTESYSVDYLSDTFSLDITTDGETVTYLSSNEDVVTVDENGNVTPVSSGTAYIYVLSQTGYDSEAATITVTVNKLTDPPVIPDDYMIVDSSYSTNKDITLPDGWSWVKTVELVYGEEVTAKAIYEDKNYTNRTITITILCTDEETGTDDTDEDESSDTDDSSDTDEDSEDDSTTSATTSSTSTSSTTSTTTSSDASPATGVGAGLAGTSAILLGAAIVAIRKKK